jgi:signal transduction histidine kinase/ligand-binding sensor domain-containing protein
MKYFIRVLFALALQIVFPNVFAQQHYFFTNYTVDDGLSDNTVNCIIKDHEGFLWIGTEAGLNRFNGYDFTVYKSLAGDSTTLPSNNVYLLMVDHAGNLWIGTPKGICLYDKKNDSFVRMHILNGKGERISVFECHALMEDSKKNILAGGTGLLRYNKQQNCFEPMLEGLPVFAKNMVTHIAEEDDGTLWLLNYFTLCHFNPATRVYKEFENKLSGPGKPGFQGLRVCLDPVNHNFLWIGTWGSGMVHFNKLTGEFISYKYQQNGSPNLDNIVTDIHAVEKTKWWLATNKGVLEFNPEKKSFGRFVRDSINRSPVVNVETGCIYKDDEGVTWIGTVGGLCNIHPAKQNFLNHPLWRNTTVNNYYFDLADDKFYGTCIYANRTLVIYDRKLNKEVEYKIPQADELRAEPFTVAKDNNGLIWIGTTKGIYTFDEKNKRFALFEIEKQVNLSSRSLYVRQILKDSVGNLWFSCYASGLLMVDADTKKITSYLHHPDDPNSFPLFAITGIAAGSGKTIYASDDRNGAIEFDYEKNKIAHFNAKKKKYAALFDATDIAVDKVNRIWITTRNNGLVCIDKNREAFAFVKDEFGNIIDGQSTIAIDDSGKIWFSSSNGIYCFNPALKSFTNFTMQDGLPYRSVPIQRLSKGKIAVHLPQGVFGFDPLRVSKTSKPLQVHLTSFAVNGKPSEYNNTIDQIDTLILKHTENNITIDFAATDFAYPSSVLYSYKLEGIDNDWSVPTRTRTVNFSQLPPGNFLLRFRSGITELNDELPEKKLFIKIIPAWWQTAFFKWTVLVVAIAVLFIAVRFLTSIRYKQQIAMLEQQRQIENIRMRISRDIHDEIGSGLTKIKLMSRNLTKAKQPGEISEATSKISNASDELIQNLAEIVWTVNPANDTLENVFAYARNYVSKIFDEHSDISSVIDFPEPANIPHNVSVNPEVKRNILLILKEALTNVIKHSNANEVYFSLREEESQLIMKISDNGKGITEQINTSMGNGIKNMRKRAESVNGKIEIRPNPVTGTSIHVFIPLQPA